MRSVGIEQQAEWAGNAWKSAAWFSSPPPRGAYPFARYPDASASSKKRRVGSWAIGVGDNRERASPQNWDPEVHSQGAVTRHRPRWRGGGNAGIGLVAPKLTNRTDRTRPLASRVVYPGSPNMKIVSRSTSMGHVPAPISWRADRLSIDRTRGSRRTQAWPAHRPDMTSQGHCHAIETGNRTMRCGPWKSPRITRRSGFNCAEAASRCCSRAAQEPCKVMAALHAGPTGCGPRHRVFAHKAAPLRRSAPAGLADADGWALNPVKAFFDFGAPMPPVHGVVHQSAARPGAWAAAYRGGLAAARAREQVTEAAGRWCLAMGILKRGKRSPHGHANPRRGRGPVQVSPRAHPTLGRITCEGSKQGRLAATGKVGGGLSSWACTFTAITAVKDAQGMQSPAGYRLANSGKRACAAAYSALAWPLPEACPSQWRKGARSIGSLAKQIGPPILLGDRTG
ncbi:hypothetical protein FQR65_LT20271 [Abscondita terminalis]|nr:hypothetical protein FQR65_LT20271 [Abscondita terminalis]